LHGVKQWGRDGMGTVRREAWEVLMLMLLASSFIVVKFIRYICDRIALDYTHIYGWVYIPCKSWINYKLNRCQFPEFLFWAYFIICNSIFVCSLGWPQTFDPLPKSYTVRANSGTVPVWFGIWPCEKAPRNWGKGFRTRHPEK
jgi:hypothetical protein